MLKGLSVHGNSNFRQNLWSKIRVLNVKLTYITLSQNFWMMNGNIKSKQTIKTIENNP